MVYNTGHNPEEKDRVSHMSSLYSSSLPSSVGCTLKQWSIDRDAIRLRSPYRYGITTAGAVLELCYTLLGHHGIAFGETRNNAFNVQLFPSADSIQAEVLESKKFLTTPPNTLVL